MQNIKYCPICQKQHPIDATECECGYKFVEQPEVVDEVGTTTNTRVIVDNTPVALWSFLGFILSITVIGIVGTFLLMKKFKEDYPIRHHALKSGFISAMIFIGIVIVVTLLLIVLNANGKIIWK